MLGVCWEEDGDKDAGWARGGEARAAPEAAFRLRLFGLGLANSSWSWVAPRGGGLPKGLLAATPGKAVPGARAALGRPRPGWLLLLPSLAQAVLAVLLYCTADQRAVPPCWAARGSCSSWARWCRLP